MSELAIELKITGPDDGLERTVTKTLGYTELAHQRMNVPPGATPVSIAPFLAQLGSIELCKFLLVISDVDGMVLTVTTTAAEEAVIPCYPFAVMGMEKGFSIATPFAATIGAPSGDETAHVLLIAVGGNPS